MNHLGLTDEQHHVADEVITVGIQSLFAIPGVAVQMMTKDAGTCVTAGMMRLASALMIHKPCMEPGCPWCRYRVALCKIQEGGIL